MVMRRKKEVKLLMDEMYEAKIFNFFKQWIKNYYGIDCFAILLILPNDDFLHLSIHSHLTKIYCENNYGSYDQPVNKIYYDNFSFYPWRLPNQTRKQIEIHTVREKIFNLNAGTNFVRSINTDQGKFRIIYCMSTYNKDPLMQYVFACNAKTILEIGDFAYNTLLPLFQENSSIYTLPKIEKLEPITDLSMLNALKNYTPTIDLVPRILKFIEKSQDENVFKLNNRIRTIYTNNTIISKRSKAKLFLI